MEPAHYSVIVSYTRSFPSASSTSYIPAAKGSTFASITGWVSDAVMQLSLKDNLLFASVTLAYQGILLEIGNVIIDTGSATTILSADAVATIHITPSPDDSLYVIRGVGGSEVVFSRHVDYLGLGEKKLQNFEIEIGGMDYGFDFGGILGMDFLMAAGAIINLRDLRVEFVD
jgi:Aspartyl protease